MSVFISKANKSDYVNTLSDEIRNEIMIAVETSLKESDLEGEEFRKAWDDAFNSRVSDLEDTIDIEYMDKVLSFYVVENLRFQQDKSGGFNIKRFDKLSDAIIAFSELPSKYTSALGAAYDGGELDFVHRIQSIPALVQDYKRSSARWENPLVDRAVNEMISKLGLEYELDLDCFDKSVLIPLQERSKKTINSYFMDKYLRPSKPEGWTDPRWGSPDMYSKDHYMHQEYLHTAINEVYVGGKGWMSGDKFLKKLNALKEYDTPERLKVMQININYVDLNGRIGQADILPGDFALLKKQTIERTARHPDIDVQIDTANKVRAEQIENKRRGKSKNKDIDEQNR